MIEARHISWAEWIFIPYINRLLRHNFFSMHLLGEMPRLDASVPVLLLPNHNTWWDGFFVHLLNKKLFHRKVYLMMLNSQLSKFPFFSKVGAFGIDPDKYRGVRASVMYSVNVLKQHSNKYPVLLCMFPQGELKPWHTHPLDYKKGYRTIAKTYAGKLSIIQMAMKAEFREEQYPEVFFMFNMPEVVSSDAIPSNDIFRVKHETLLKNLQTAIREGQTGIPIFHGKKSISTKVEQLGH
jgi:1-acyl-sn-glycerol-3-phosphate acyltransferase